MRKKWIKLASPQVALNAPNVKKFIMKYSRVIPWDWGADRILGKEAVPDGVKHLIFNCHGYVTRESFGAPHLSIGTVIHKGNISAFERLRNIPELKVIWIAACNIAGGEGLEFCKIMATTSGCYVVAQVLGVPDIAVKSDHIEDYSYAMPVYIQPSGEPVSRDKFFELGDALGFKRV
jgi:hypothetical protein